MKDVLKKAIDHPFATTWIIGSVASSVSMIIRAAKGKSVETPTINIDLQKKNEE
jgi:hypothetical protein